MKIKRLSFYIEKYVSAESAILITEELESQNIWYVSIDEAIHMIHIALSDMCSKRTLGKIMKRVLRHEVKHNRLTEQDVIFFVELYGYDCFGCTHNLLDHTEHVVPGGCMVYE
jgi:hypothetical protein